MRVTTSLFGCAIGVALTLAACGGEHVPAPDPLAGVPGTVLAIDAPVVAPVVVAPVVAVPVAPATTSVDADARAGLHVIERGVVACFANPVACDTSRLAAPDSPALAYLDGLRRHYLNHDLIAREAVPGLRYIVPERVEQLRQNRVAVTLCEVDGSWQMDRRGTDDPADDAVFDDTLVSRRARHELVRMEGRWLRWDITELELWIGVNRCPEPSSP